jgi:hypothetical protein
VRRLARETGLARATVHRIWRSHRLKPHRTRTFELLARPELEAKVIAKLHELADLRPSRTRGGGERLGLLPTPAVRGPISSADEAGFSH